MGFQPPGTESPDFLPRREAGGMDAGHGGELLVGEKGVNRHRQLGADRLAGLAKAAEPGEGLRVQHLPVIDPRAPRADSASSTAMASASGMAMYQGQFSEMALIALSPKIATI